MTGSNRSRRPGLQGRWRYVVDSLEEIVPIYEVGSSRIALFSDAAMRDEVVRFAARKGSTILDLGSGPGTMSKLISSSGARPVLLDVSKKMLASAPMFERVRAVFEFLPFRRGAFDGVVAGFSLRDARDLRAALFEISNVISRAGRFGFCDLGKPSAGWKKVALALYLRAGVPLIGLVSGGRRGLAFASLFQTYLLTLDNSAMVMLLQTYFEKVVLNATKLGGSIVVTCSESRGGRLETGVQFADEVHDPGLRE